MGDRSPGDDDVEALAAIWGREASADAPASPRPDIEALVGARPAPEPPPAPRPLRRPRRLLLIPLVLALVAVAAVVAVRVADDGDDGAASGVAGTTTTTAPTTTTEAPLARPLWTAAVTCPRFEDDSGAGRVECPVATDDERAYALVAVEATIQVRALDAATGQVRWEQDFPEGARTVLRTPSVVAVGGVATGDPETWPADGGQTVALDPVTGERRWARPGRVVSVAGAEHLVLDHQVAGGGSTISTTTVVEAVTGREVLTRTGRSEGLYVHGCPRAGTVLVSEGTRLSAHGVADGVERWAVEATHLDLYQPLACDHGRVAFVQGADLRLLDLATGAEIASVAIAGADQPAPTQVRGLAGDTVVVGSFAATRGYRADAGLELLWESPCPECGTAVLVGPAGDEGVLVVQRGEAEVRSGADGGLGPHRLALLGTSETVLEDGLLLAWGPDRLVVADPADVAGAVLLAIDGARSAAAGSVRLVVATEDEVRGYLREG